MTRFDGFDSCIVGYTDSFVGGSRVERIIYSAEKIVALLVRESGMSEPEAWEYLDFNIAGAYVGEATPIILYPHPEFEGL